MLSHPRIYTCVRRGTMYPHRLDTYFCECNMSPDGVDTYLCMGKMSPRGLDTYLGAAKMYPRAVETLFIEGKMYPRGLDTYFCAVFACFLKRNRRWIDTTGCRSPGSPPARG